MQENKFYSLIKFASLGKATLRYIYKQVRIMSYYLIHSSWQGRGIEHGQLTLNSLPGYVATKTSNFWGPKPVLGIEHECAIQCIAVLIYSEEKSLGPSKFDMFIATYCGKFQFKVSELLSVHLSWKETEKFFWN